MALPSLAMAISGSMPRGSVFGAGGPGVVHRHVKIRRIGDSLHPQIIRQNKIPMRLAPIFSEHAVLQRNQPIPVWGTAGANQDVLVTLAGNEATVMAAADGTWMVRLPPLPAGGPHEISAKAASGEACVRDVLVGEVWICSGQSNMEWLLAYTPQELGVAESHLPQIRLLTVKTPAKLGRQTDIDGTWSLANQKTLSAFSAVGVWFGRALHERLKVPVGLICNAWGGSRVQAWLSREALMLDPAGIDEVRGYEAFAYKPRSPDAVETPAAWEKRLRSHDISILPIARTWHTSAFSDHEWPTMKIPSAWQAHGHPGTGIFWFRRTIPIPASWIGRDLELNLGAIDKHDDTWVEGHRVGGLSWEDGEDTWCHPRTYRISGATITRSTVSIAVRARSHMYQGGMIGPDRLMCLHPIGDQIGEQAQRVELAGDWRYTIEQDWGVETQPGFAFEPGSPNTPYTLFDSRLAPLIPYGIRGVIWYQGESNAGEPALYRQLLPQMIADWRRAFGQGRFPFLQVQLANFMPPAENPGASDWALLREAQLATALEDPHGGLAVTIDVGDANDVHPTNKRDVGERLARWTLANHYGLGGAASGPLFESMVLEANGRVRCRFRYATGLCTRDGQAPRSVAIAGADRAFVWAEAIIDGETLVAWHPKVPSPYAVRYAWANNPDTANLISANNVPASPFRSDSW